MKFTKMSLVAAILVAGTSAFAIDNVKVSGDAKLYYSTSDDAKHDLFAKEGAAGQAALGLGVTADLLDNVSAGAHLTALSTLGLEGQLVDNVWEATNGVSDSFWFDQAWIAATAGKTTAKIGRMELDTPLVFTEKWSIVENTFEAAVVLNQDIPDTTLVGAYVGGSNGQLVGKAGGGLAGVINPMNENGTTNFSQFYDGAYAAGVVNNSWKPLTVQAWYFHASHVTNAYWLEADLSMEGILAGAQYTGIDSITGITDKSSSAWAAMVGYDMKDVATVKASYSSVDKDGIGAGFNLAGTGQSKLYTEAWWNYTYVVRPDTTSYNVTVESPVDGMFDLGAYYTNATVDSADNQDMSEITVTAGKKFGPLDATLAYVYTDAEDQNEGDAYNTIQAYLTLNF